MASTANVDVSVETSGTLQRRMTVRVPSAEIEREIDVRLKTMGKTARLKGFRPGKVPVKVVRKRFGGQVRQEVMSDVIRTSFSRAISQERLSPAGSPSIEPLAGRHDGHFSYRAVFEVYPEIELKGVEGLAIEQPEVEIEEADVDAMIEKLRARLAKWESVERAAAPGDRVTVDFVGTIRKEAFAGGEGKDVPIVLGSGQVIQDFDKALKGVEAGGRKRARVKFPKDYPADELAGKKAVFNITVHRVEVEVLPEIDDDFLEAFGVDEGGIEELRSQVLDNMKRELDERLRSETNSVVLEAFLKANVIEVPNALVEQEISYLQAEAMRRLGTEDPEQVPAREIFAAAAARRVTISLLVQKFIAQHGLELDRSLVDERIDSLAAPYEDPQEAARTYRTNRDLMAQVESAVVQDQVVELLRERAEVTAKKMSFEKVMSPPQDAESG
ncbi:trigger factor [Candidatus Rariloculus sp.]|uniref:trigger factor n=1 Tax=Candidatus Rariloculus sp. TaxID=3101265 RepID=UPI003D1062DD